MTSRFYFRGVTLVELIAFIVVMSVITAGLMNAFSSTLKGSGAPKQMTQGLQLAQERMELTRARKDLVGFACFTGTRFDPCNNAAAGACAAFTASVHPACSAQPSPGFTVVSALDETGACVTPADTNYKCITVTASGPDGQMAQIISAVANY